MSANQKKLKQTLDQQKSSNVLDLNELILGDDGCKLVSDFLRENNHITALEIRGDNISGIGFAKICQGMKNNLRMHTLIAEWNQIGNNQKGLEQFKSLIEENPALQTIDFKNNGIKPEGAVILAQILQTNPNIVSLDLKWNEIGVKGGQYLIEAIQLNTKLKNLDLSCNKVPQEMIQEINRILARNRSGQEIPIIQQKRQTLPQATSQQSLKQSTNQNTGGKKDQSQFLNTQALDQIASLENNKVKQVKNQLEKELDDVKRMRETLENNFKKLRDEVIRKENVKQDLELTYNNLMGQNHLLKLDLDKEKFDIQELIATSTNTLAELQERMTGNQRAVSSLERQEMLEIDGILAENQNFTKCLVRDWTLRYNALEDNYRSMRIQKEELEEQANIGNQNLLRFDLDHEEGNYPDPKPNPFILILLKEIRKLKIRIQDDLRKRNQESIRILEERHERSQDMMEATKRKNLELIKEMNYKDTQATDRINILEDEANQYRTSINELHLKLSKFNMKIEKFKCENLKKEGEIEKNEEELGELQRVILRIKDSQREQHDHIVMQHNHQRRIFKESSEQQHMRICQIEKAIRIQDAENAKLKSDYERLCNQLQHGINRTVMESLQIHQDLLHGRIIQQL